MLGYNAVISTGSNIGLEYAWLPKQGWPPFGRRKQRLCPDCCNECPVATHQATGETREGSDE